MIRIKDTLAGKRVWFHCVQSRSDAQELREFVLDNDELGIDTESTGINCYRQGWKLRTTQVANFTDSYVIPAKFKGLVAWMLRQNVYWLGHNGPHDIRCLDTYLGYETGVICEGETSIPGRHKDARNQSEGGIGHGLKEQAAAFIDPQAGKWEKALKEAFKEIKVPVPGEFYKSSNKSTGTVRGEPKMRTIKLEEGWALIDPYHPAYIAYAAADPLLTKWLWHKHRRVVERNPDLYSFDHDVSLSCDRLQRRAMRLDVGYTQQLSRAYTQKADGEVKQARAYGCDNIDSTAQIAAVLLDMKVNLTEKTKTGKWKVTGEILRKIQKRSGTPPQARRFINAVLVAKQVYKRREAYTDAMLREMDSNSRVHPSINPLAARTTRMSVSNPALQQLPTRDKQDEVLWDVADDIS